MAQKELEQQWENEKKEYVKEKREKNTAHNTHEIHNA